MILAFLSQCSSLFWVHSASLCLPIVVCCVFLVAPARAVKFAPASVRFMGTQSPAASPDVVIPELHDTLEWVLSSPPSVHQFEEPPVS